ncbi:MAG: excinuclease ABC subunit B [Candidatus Lloydbacteria bacterium CG22_combo_CG10-13_8_21_14_all_47_15]|uniref:UvrABC system protein B n=1 Tax=Candidatus Lloydbacteria bacterium CG22_combo_CG10-13_8_21_14_all_47_15 TaxID=1974635 RepID=A0A2H0CVR6_9BACT|nr:MAG: excinuclease ABC subunit B [Candidatus Lloydbacteria bacterium CG22_combo_CG10-13_8_21_14_all_47_15]
MSNNRFKLWSEYKPDGDQPGAIQALIEGIKKGIARQTLFGVTGSGKTFTVANVIEAVQKPTLVIAHNKTLAAQLAQEYKAFFPDNAVHYFVSYYDYYQPEAYMPITDTYIEKDAQINDEIDRLRHASTQSLLTRRDVIIVASVSCIYGLGSPEEYKREHVILKRGARISRNELMRRLVSIFYERTNADLKPGTFRAIGNKVEIMPPHEVTRYAVEFSDEGITAITKIDAISSAVLDEPDTVFFFPAKHFVTDKTKRDIALKNILSELTDRVKELKEAGQELDAERLARRTKQDIAMIREVGYCNGIENYSRHLSGRAPGEPPYTLLSYFPQKKDGTPDFLTVIDESHVTIPQISGMYEGDASRKRTLVEYGFRLPSALDNRPFKFNEFEARVGNIIFTSATPASYERETSTQIVEQIIRPTGLIDPAIKVCGVVEAGKYPGQISNFITEAEKEVATGNRVIATTLTKKMAEDLSLYLKDRGLKAEYLHSEIKTIDRIRILTRFRKGEFDCLVGVNLLREGLDLPEVSFIGILDADKEGFLRSETSLIQIIGRAARNVAGRVILYADMMTGSMRRAIDETNRRREKQISYNKKHGITPQTIKKTIHDITETLETSHEKAVKALISIDRAIFADNPKKLKRVIADKDRQMNAAVKILDFETAAILRDEIKTLEELAKK